MNSLNGNKIKLKETLTVLENCDRYQENLKKSIIKMCAWDEHRRPHFNWFKTYLNDQSIQKNIINSND